MVDKKELSSLERELMEKLPPEQINIDAEKGIISYYDYHAVTFSDNEAEDRVANEYIVKIAEEKLGYTINVTYWSDSNNGRFAHNFERA